MQSKLRHIPYWGGLALLAYMPFHIFLAQWLSTFTGGLDIWKGAKDALTFALLLVAVGLVAIYSKNTPRAYWYLTAAGAVYGLIHVATYEINKDTSLQVAALATAYNCRLLAYAIIGFSAVLLTPEKLQPRKLIKLILIISTVVCVIGLLQYILPKDLMTHFGYSVERGVKPAFFINDDTDFPRIMSTIRDPNSLGAYLLLPIMLLVSLLAKRPQGKTLIRGLLGLHLLVLYLSFSRAALGGLVIMLGVYAFISHRQKVLAAVKRFWPLLLVAVLFTGVVAYSIKDTKLYRSVVLRADDKNPVEDLDSDELHLFYAQEGLSGVVEKPLGYGPGTAGIVSIQNPDNGLLTENYYVQIAHEVGVLGLVLFTAVWAYIVLLLWRAGTLLSRSLVFVSVAYAVMAVVMHLWSNEAIAAQWWLLVGMVLMGYSKQKAKE
jgi:hypothetical protein